MAHKERLEPILPSAAYHLMMVHNQQMAIQISLQVRFLHPPGKMAKTEQKVEMAAKYRLQILRTDIMEK